MIKNKTAIYCRLSKEDERNSSSTSIINQQEFLIEYAKKHNYNLINIYIDDGYSGGNFERPGFRKLIKDIESKKIDTILVKDLSRLGRNYLEVGNYIENYFPINNVRLIAVNDNFDSNNGEDDFSPFKNIINQWYLKDISKKVKSVHELRMKKGFLPKGEFIPLFGYMYNEFNERIIDPISSKVVKKVFELYNKGLSTNKIKEELIKNRMVTPSYYNYEKYNYNFTKYMDSDKNKKYAWNAQAINRIISNIEYTGELILKKKVTISYKTHKRRLSKDEEKYVFKNRFIPIIDIDTWQHAEKIRKSKIHSKKYEDDIFHNLVFCGGCKKALSYVKSSNNLYLVCRRKCSYPNRINYSVLLDIVAREIKYFFQIILNNDMLEKYYKKINNNENKDLEHLIIRNKTIEKAIEKLYYEYLENKVSIELFTKINNSYLKELTKRGDFLYNQIISA